MKRNIIFMACMMAMTAFGGEHYLLQIPATSIISTNGTYGVTNALPSGVHVAKQLALWATKASGTVSEIAVTGSVSAVKNGQSRTIFSTLVMTSGVPYISTAGTIPLYDETIVANFAANGTTSVSVVGAIIYEE